MYCSTRILSVSFYVAHGVESGIDGTIRISSLQIYFLHNNVDIAGILSKLSCLGSIL